MANERDEEIHTDPRSRAQKLAAMAESDRSHSPLEAQIARRKLDELLEREGAALSRSAIEAEGARMSPVAFTYLVAEYERWAQAGRPRHTREWRT